MGELLIHVPQGLEPKSPGRGLERQVGPRRLAHHARHGPALAADLARTGVAELAAVGFLQALVVEEAVQVRGMRRIDAHLEGLQPVAVPQAFEGEHMAVGRAEAVQRGQRRRLRAVGPEPAEQHPRAGLQRIALLPDARAQAAAFGLGRGFDALAGHVELPAVERAAQAIGLAAAERQVGAAVRAIAVEQAKAPLCVLEQHQVLAEHAHRLYLPVRHARVEPGVELVEQRHRLPVAAQQLSGGGVRAHAGQAVVLVSTHRGS